MSVLVAPPDLTAPAVMGGNKIVEEFNLKNHLNGSMGWVFLSPLNFTEEHSEVCLNGKIDLILPHQIAHSSTSPSIAAALF